MITSVEIKPGYPQGGSDAERGTHWEIRYVVLSNSRSDGPMAVLAALPFTLGSAYSYQGEVDPYALCREVTAPERIGPMQWEASCIFDVPERNQPQNNPATQETDPFLRPPDISRTTERHQVPVWRAHRWLGTGWGELEAVVNSAGGMYAQPLMEDRDRLVLDYTRNERYFPGGHADQFRNTINSNVFLGAAAGTALCRFITGSWVAEQVGSAWSRFWKVHYQFVFDPDGFDDWILDQGAFYRDTRPSIGGDPNPDFNKLASTRDKDGVPMGGPFLLDGNGGLLDDSKAMAGEGVYRIYRYRKERDFSPMNIVLPY